jgi:uncharacterized protein YjbJ (UPF0337 family)
MPASVRKAVGSRRRALARFVLRVGGARASSFGGAGEGERPMNWDQVEGKWDAFKGQLRTKWAKLTDDDIEAGRGRRETLVGKIQQRYGDAKDSIERQLDDLLGKM